MMRLLRRIQSMWLQTQVERDLREELEAHRAMRQRALEAMGVPPHEAANASRRAMGNITLAREDARGVWVWPWLECVWQDVGYAVRVMRRAPGFAAAIVLVLSLGIGATTGVFSLLDGLVLKPVPVQRPDRLVYIGPPSYSYPLYRETAARGSHVLSSLSAWNLTDANIEWTSELEPAEVLTASGNFYSTLGVNAVAGRVFAPDDDRIGGGGQGLVAVISHAAWQRRFGGDAAAIGSALRIDGRPFTIIGVTPPGFFGVTPGTRRAQPVVRVDARRSRHAPGRRGDPQRCRAAGVLEPRPSGGPHRTDRRAETYVGRGFSPATTIGTRRVTADPA
jgi:hypothetical protein